MIVPTQAPPLLAADVGGTHARMALVAGDVQGAPEVLAHASFRCADHPDLATIAARFLDGLEARVQVAVIASAGHALPDGSLLSANLPWPVSPRQLRHNLGVEEVYLVNDFQALAHAVRHLDPRMATPLGGPAHAQAGPLLVLGPGTGLGAAVWVPAPGGGLVLATEAGQAALPVRTARELQVLQRLQAGRGHVSIEHVLSGPGLLALYRAVCDMHGAAPLHAQPAAVSAAALTGADALAREALDLFCELLGATAGDLALMYGARRVYLAGGILPRMAPFLSASGFAARFVDKGPMRSVLEQVPVGLVEHGQLGLIGAASWYLDGHASRA